MAEGSAGVLGGVILCGGESRRMGRSKARLPLGGVPLLVRVAEALRAELGPGGAIVVVAAPGQDLPELPEEVTVVRDPVGGRGPLQGIAAGLRGLPQWVELAYVSGTDAPFLRPGWIPLLARWVGAGDCAVPEAAGFRQPLAALYRRAPAASAAEVLLGEGATRLLDLLDRLRGVVVPERELRAVDPELMTLRNLNTPEDYERALREWG